ncbi:MAG: sulfite exporter TauE/SafE family protein [Bdellovibrionota bacterium]
MTLLLNLLLGIAVGCYGTLVGAGGGFLLVPLFLLVYKMPHETAVGTSLAIVAFNAFSGAAGYVRHGRVDFRAGITFAIATVPGAIGGAYLTSMMSGPLFLRVFGVFLIGVSLYLFFRKERKKVALIHGKRGWGWVTRKTKTAHGEEEYEYFEPLGLSISVVVGAVSSWLGIGGGILHVPAMTEILCFPVHVAVATSHFVLAWTALVGAVMHGLRGHWDPTIALTMGIGALLGAQLGVKLSHKAKGSALLRYLSLALLLVGIRLIVG